MKQMEYTIKVVTNGPIELGDLIEPLKNEIEILVSADVTNYRVKPTPRKA